VSNGIGLPIKEAKMQLVAAVIIALLFAIRRVMG
jgi:hypothetical protein